MATWLVQGLVMSVVACRYGGRSVQLSCAASCDVTGGCVRARAEAGTRLVQLLVLSLMPEELLEGQHAAGLCRCLRCPRWLSGC